MALFRSLKNKLKRFKNKAEKELEDVIEVEVIEEDEVDKNEILQDDFVEVVKEDIVTGRETSLEDLRKVREIVEGVIEEPSLAEEKKKEKISVLGGKRIRESKLEDVLAELELILLESDIAFEAVEHVIESVREKLIGAKVKRKEEIGDYIEQTLKEAIREMLSINLIDFDEFVVNAKEKPLKIMFVGVNGTGKTTVIAKIAHRLLKMGRSVIIAASDTFRAGAIEQLEIHAKRLGVKLIKHRPGSDPSAVAYDAIEHAKARHKDVVLIDTAGRIQTNKNLMNEMKKIKQVTRPHLIVFVGDALAGNDAIEQARKFDETVGIDCAILTKIDADAKGGAALSIAYAVKKPILFLGIGQGYQDLLPYSPDWMLNHIFEEEERSKVEA
ncbi:MAG TPA: signal recognition particle-docking protein FtsY [Thermoplasmata archaeon]|nr:signal recognition particle-docking protein FtsY [Thermoplasmata archaeon]